MAKLGNIPWNKGKKGLQVAWNKGKKMPNAIYNLGKFAYKGAIPWNKGKINIYSKEVLYAMSIGHKGQLPYNTGKKRPEVSGKNHWLYGKHHSEKTRIKMSMKNQHINKNEWKGFITPKDHLERVKFRRTIQKMVLERDNYKCVLCRKGGELQVDHIQSWKDYVELRFNINNCRTLCAKCHYQITFGRPMPSDVKTWGHNLPKEVEGL